MSRKSTENLRKEVANYRKKGLSFNEIARLMHFTPQYAHYLTKPYIEKIIKGKEQSIIDYRNKIKSDIFGHYTRGKFECACCKEKNWDFLTLDHIHANGKKERTKNPRKGIYLYAWLRKNNYPSGYQILCFNCNIAKRDKKFCPHKNLTYPHPIINPLTRIKTRNKMTI